MAAAGHLQFLQDAHQAEAMAAVNAIDVVLNMGIRKVVLESDAQNLCTSLSRGDEYYGINGVILKEAKCLIVDAFDSVVSFCPRGCSNVLAHELAKFGASLDSTRPGCLVRRISRVCNSVGS